MIPEHFAHRHHGEDDGTPPPAGLPVEPDDGMPAPGQPAEPAPDGPPPAAPA
jgi:hypothetical protein